MESKSKRVSLKQKYKVIRKVKEHHKKKAKDAKKQGLNKRPKVEKDPGIPNDWPFKEQELKALEARRALALEELEQKKAARKERARKRKLGLPEDDDVDASKEQNAGEETVKTEPIVKIRDIEKMVLKAGPQKQLVLLLNKIDLVPKVSVEKWLKYFREELPAVAFKCSTQHQKSNLGKKYAAKGTKKTPKPSSLLESGDCLGAQTLTKLLKKYSKSREITNTITVGVVGLPNVGKSSLINSLKRCHVVDVSATPGLTKSMQEVELDKNIKLLDCPGVVMVKSEENEASIALRNCMKIDKVDDPTSPVKEIFKLCPAKTLVMLYRIPSFDSVDEFLQNVATARGKLKKGGIVDVDAAARIVLHDWNEGRIPYYTMPPTREGGEPMQTNIISELGKKFNVDEVYATESSFIENLKSAEDFQLVEVPANGPLTFDEKLFEDELQPQPVPARKGTAHSKNTGSDNNEPMDEDDAGEKKAHTAGDQKNTELNDADGVLDTKVRKADKRAKKAKKSSSTEDMEGDYDFKVDYFKKDTVNDDASDEEDIPANTPSNDADTMDNTSTGSKLETPIELD
uniref:CP-type G domain-containing protein n=1 Tax=Daucus carota subsp. sativus TaxID=79200 RepID=A0A169WHA3_DAUCS